MTVRDAVLVVFCGLAAFSLCYAKVGRHESINDLFTDEETFHYTDDHVKLREELKVDQDAVQKAFRFVITYNVSVIAQLILKPIITWAGRPYLVNGGLCMLYIRGNYTALGQCNGFYWPHYAGLGPCNEFNVALGRCNGFYWPYYTALGPCNGFNTALGRCNGNYGPSM